MIEKILLVKNTPQHHTIGEYLQVFDRSINQTKLETQLFNQESVFYSRF